MNSYRKCVCHFHCPLSTLSPAWMGTGIHICAICTVTQSSEFNGGDGVLCRFSCSGVGIIGFCSSLDHTLTVSSLGGLLFMHLHSSLTGEVFRRHPP